MMHGRGKSDSVVVAVKPANKVACTAAEQSAAEPAAAESVEPRAETKGNAGQQSTRQAQNWESVPQTLDRIRRIATAVCRLDPRWEPYAGKPHVRICAGGAQ